MPSIPSLFPSNSHSRSSLNIYHVGGPKSSGGEHDRCGPVPEGGHKLKEEKGGKGMITFKKGKKDGWQTRKDRMVGPHVQRPGGCADVRSGQIKQGEQEDRKMGREIKWQRELQNASEWMKALTREADQTSTSSNSEPSNTPPKKKQNKTGNTASVMKLASASLGTLEISFSWIW